MESLLASLLLLCLGVCSMAVVVEPVTWPSAAIKQTTATWRHLKPHSCTATVLEPSLSTQSPLRLSFLPRVQEVVAAAMKNKSPGHWFDRFPQSAKPHGFILPPCGQLTENHHIHYSMYSTKFSGWTSCASYWPHHRAHRQLVLMADRHEWEIFWEPRLWRLIRYVSSVTQCLEGWRRRCKSLATTCWCSSLGLESADKAEQSDSEKKECHCHTVSASSFSDHLGCDTTASPPFRSEV